MSERTIPILPCPSIDDVLAFYEALGFAVTYRQERPNTYAVVARGGIELQFFVLKGLDPAQSYSSCYVLVSAVDELYEAFRVGISEKYGRIPARGIPRIGPLRDMSYGVRQFVVVDPGGNAIRIGQPIEIRPTPTAESAGRLERALTAAVTLTDSKGDDLAAAQVLDSAFRDDPPVAGPIAARALILRADLAYRLGDDAGARASVAQTSRLALSDEEQTAIRDELRRVAELGEALAPD